MSLDQDIDKHIKTIKVSLREVQTDLKVQKTVIKNKNKQLKEYQKTIEDYKTNLEELQKENSQLQKENRFYFKNNARLRQKTKGFAKSLMKVNLKKLSEQDVRYRLETAKEILCALGYSYFSEYAAE